MQRERLQNYVDNGQQVTPTFSATEMERRLTNIRKVMSDLGIDAALFSSYHNINYFSDFLFCYFGRRYGLLVDHNISTSISAGIDGGQRVGHRLFGIVMRMDAEVAARHMVGDMADDGANFRRPKARPPKYAAMSETQTKANADTKNTRPR